MAGSLRPAVSIGPPWNAILGRAFSLKPMRVEDRTRVLGVARCRNGQELERLARRGMNCEVLLLSFACAKRLTAGGKKRRVSNPKRRSRAPQGLATPSD